MIIIILVRDCVVNFCCWFSCDDVGGKNYDMYKKIDNTIFH